MSEVLWFRPCGFLALLCVLSINLQVPLHLTFKLGLETASCERNIQYLLLKGS